MANSEHVEIVKQGTAVIARWREVHRGEALDLRGADLTELDLSGNHWQLLASMGNYGGC